VVGQGSVSPDVLARYAADAAREVEGVRSLVESHLHRHRGVRVTRTDENGAVAVELHLEVEWGRCVPDVGKAVQRRVAEYLEQMAGARPKAVDVIVDEIAPNDLDQARQDRA
jgi:uncharacterized alkaline shock family protein YloU